jgi:hypothetical protein
MGYVFGYPAPNDAFGPGSQFSVGWDGSGTRLGFNQWELRLGGFATNLPLSRFIKSNVVAGSDIVGIMGYENEVPTLRPGLPRVTTSPQILTARATLQPDPTVVVEVSTTVTYVDSGQFFLQGTATGGGGTDPVLKADVEIIKQAVTPVSVNLGGLAEGLMGLATHPPFNVLRQELITPPRSGDGTLIRPFNPEDNDGVAAVGLTWAFVNVPDGIGQVNGNPLLYRSRMLETATIHYDQQEVEFVSEVQEWTVNKFWWLWSNPLPSRIEYSILPGVVLNFFWLIITGT